MTPPMSRQRFRVLNIFNFLVLSAIVLPEILGHDYPEPWRASVKLTGLAVYALGALVLYRASRRATDASSAAQN